MLGLSQPLGLSPTYVDAQRIVTALERAQTDPTYYDTAIEILNSYVGAQQVELVNKAIVLGADPEILRSLLQPAETIVIEDKGPVISVGGKRRVIPWTHIGLGLAGIVGAIFAYRKWGKTLLR